MHIRSGEMDRIRLERAERNAADNQNRMSAMISALERENAKLREENAELVKVLHEVEYEAVDAYLSLQHDCELLVGELENRFRRHWHEQCENAKLRELVRDLYEMAYPECPSAFEAVFADRMCELGIEVSK